MICTRAEIFGLPAEDAPPLCSSTRAPLPFRLPACTPRAEGRQALPVSPRLLVCLTALFLALASSLSIAHAQTPTEFDFSKPSAGGFVNAGDSINFYGLVEYYKQQDNLGVVKSSAIQIVYGNQYRSDGDDGHRYGAAYFNSPVDVSKGFDTTFSVGSHANRGLAFLIKNLDEASAVNSPGGALGYEGFSHSVAVDFDYVSHIVSLQVPWTDGRLHQGSNVFLSAPLPAPPPGRTYDTTNLGNVALRYSPQSRLMDVYINNQLILRATDFRLDDYKTLDNRTQPGAATIGFIGGGIASNGNPSGITIINTWQFGNNLNTFGVDASYFSQLMTFTTTGQSLWGTGSDTASWDSGSNYTTNYAKSVSKQGSSHGFSGAFNASSNSIDNGIGLRFTATATGGTTDITYPLYLGLLFPRQQSVALGQKFQIASAFYPDRGASFTTSSPSAGFKAFASLGTHSHADFNAGFPLIGSFGGTLFDFDTKADNFTIFDTDFILRNAAAFGLVKDASEQKVSLQDDEGVNGPKQTHRGSPSEGSTKGAKKGVNPLDFIQLNLFVPNLGVSGYRPSDSKTPSLSGSAQSDVIGVHADVTSAILDLILKGSSHLLNSDVSFDLGAGNKYALGWHFEDLYGDLNLGVQLTHQFAPAPHVRLHFTDLDGNPANIAGQIIKDVEYDLPADGSPVDSPEIPMTHLPLVVTPTVYLSNADARQSGYNTFSTTADLTIGGDVALNYFQMYLQIPNVADLDTAPVLPPLQWEKYSVIHAIKAPKPFQMGGFNVVVGQSFTLLPQDASNPLIVSASPRSGPRATDNASATVTLKCRNVSADAGVVWDRNQPTQTRLSANGFKTSDTDGNFEVSVTVPGNLRGQRGAHTLTVVNGIDNFNQSTIYPSNAVTYTVEELVPNVDKISPFNIVLTTPPSEARTGTPLLQNGASGDTGVTEQYFTLTVNGSNFVDALPGLPGSVVRWNERNLPTLFVTSKQLQARVPASFIRATGTAQVTVFNALPGGGESSALTVAMVNPTPTANRLSPSTSFAGAAGMTTMILGSSFTRDSQVKWNGSPRPTTFFSSTQLEVELSSDDLKDGGTALIGVTNGQGLDSQLLKFTMGVTPVRTVLQVTPTLTRDAGDGSILVTLAVKNIGSSPALDLFVGSAVITGAGSASVTGQLDNAAHTALPQGLGDLMPGESATLSGVIRFPSSTGAKGAAVLLNVYGSFSDGPFAARQRIVLP